jgi:carboxylesterase type B
MAFNAVERNTNRSAIWKLIFYAGSELHGATAPFLASNETGWPAANNHTLAEVISSYWISFAVTGDPNPMKIPQAPYWESYMSDGPGNMSNGESIGFQTQYVTYTSIKPRVDPDAKEGCEFFGAHGYDVMN